MTFWQAVLVLGIAVLLVIVIDMFDRWREVVFPPRKPHEIERVRRIETAAIQDAQDAKDRARWAQVFPAPKGPHGFSAQNERRSAQRHRVSEFKHPRMN